MKDAKANIIIKTRCAASHWIYYETICLSNRACLGTVVQQ